MPLINRCGGGGVDDYLDIRVINYSDATGNNSDPGKSITWSFNNTSIGDSVKFDDIADNAVLVLQTTQTTVDTSAYADDACLINFSAKLKRTSANNYKVYFYDYYQRIFGSTAVGRKDEEEYVWNVTAVYDESTNALTLTSNDTDNVRFGVYKNSGLAANYIATLIFVVQ